MEKKEENSVEHLTTLYTVKCLTGISKDMIEKRTYAISELAEILHTKDT